MYVCVRTRSACGVNNLFLCVLQAMLNAILTRLHRAVDDAYVPLFSNCKCHVYKMFEIKFFTRQLENSTKHSEFFNRQFWSCVKVYLIYYIMEGGIVLRVTQTVSS